jgi:hypothetical protein
MDQLGAWAAALAPPWRGIVERALAARGRFLAVVAPIPPGPTRQRLEELAPAVEGAVQRIADSAWRAIRARELAATLDVAAATDELKEARRDLDVRRRAGGDTTAQERLVASLAERHRAVNEALNLADDAEARLEELNLRLDTMVAHASTIALRSTLEGPDDLDRELDDIVVGLAALDDALRTLDR